MVRALLLATGLLGFRATGAAAQESYTIQLKGAGQGETTRYEDTLTAEMRTRQVDATDLVVSDRRDRSVRRTSYHETPLEVDATTRRATRFRRQCDRATLEVNGKDSPLPYHGKSFVVERGAEGCRVRFEGTAPPDDFIRELEEGFHQKKDFNPLEGLLPGKAVQVSETWAFDPRPLFLAWPKPPQVRIDLAKASGTGKLCKVYRAGERLFGVLEFQVEAPVVGVEFGPKKADAETGTRLAMRLTLDACLDGSASTFSLRMVDELTVHMQLPGPTGLVIRGTITEEHVRSETRR